MFPITFLMRGEREKEREREREREIASDHSRKDHATGRTRPRRRVCERRRRRSIDSASSLRIAKKRRKVSRIDRSIHRERNFCGSLSTSCVRSRVPTPPKNEEDVKEKQAAAKNAKYEHRERRICNTHLAAGETPDRDYHDDGASFFVFYVLLNEEKNGFLGGNTFPISLLKTLNFETLMCEFFFTKI